MPVPIPQGPTYKKKYKTHVVRQGSASWNAIANQTGVPVSALAAANQGASLVPGLVVKIPRQETIENKLSNENVVGPVTTNVYRQGVSQRDLTRSGQGVKYSYLGAYTQPTPTVLPDTYNAQLNAPGIDYQKQRLTAFEQMGTPAPTINVDVARTLGYNEVTLIQAGYIKQGNTWVYTTPTGGATGAQQQSGPRGDYWQYKQDIALANAQAYGSPNAKRRNTKEMLEYKEAKKSNPDLTYREWLMRKGGKWKQANAQYSTSTEEEEGTAAVQPYYSYSNSGYSSTGRYISGNYGGAITWRT